MRFESIPLDHVDWADLDRFSDRVFSQRRAWLEFVGETHRGRPVVARFEDGGSTIGYFTGVTFRRFGLRIMGSPFPGWTTPYMGFNLAPGVPRADAVAALLPFVFRDLGCLHVELADPYLTASDVARFGFETHVGTTFVSDLSLDEEKLFSLMDSACRRCVRKAEKSGVKIEEAGPEGFADEYYAHLVDVFAKQHMRPTYGLERVASLVRHVHPSGDLLLLRARDADGRSIATGIFPGFNRMSYFFGNGSLRQFQGVRPNEAIHWYAMRHWKARGIHSHYWGGGGQYKEKYGGRRVETTHFRLSRFAVVGLARDMARKLYYLPRVLKRTRHLRRINRAP